MSPSRFQSAALPYVIAFTLLLACAAPRAARAQIPTGPGVFFTGSPSWQPGPDYPGGPFIAGSCAVWNSTITCVGGTTNDQTWTAPLTANGIGNWVQGADYGEGGQNHFLGCATGQSDYIYCVGGDNLGGQTADVTSDTWWSPLSTSQGALNWSSTNELLDLLMLFDGGKITNGLWSSSCFTHNGILYCVGGFIETQSLVVSLYGDTKIPVDTPTSGVFANRLGMNGAGGWSTTTAYGEGIAGQSCVTYGGYVYCVGGVTGNGFSNSDVADVWYAPFEADGNIGAWKQTTSYGGGPVDGESCTVVAGQIVCVGGNFNGGSGGNSAQVWTAPLSANGVGTWVRTITSYPENVWEPSCVANLSTISCIGGGSTAGGWQTLGQSVAGDVHTYNIGLQVQINLGDAESCSVLGGTWDSSSSLCSVAASQTLRSGETLNILPGTSLVIGAPQACGSGCGYSVAFANAGSMEIEPGGQLLNYGLFTNTGSIGNNGVFDNQASFVNMGTFDDLGSTNQLAGTFSNEGMVTNSGSFAAQSGVQGSITVDVNANTCYAAGPLGSVISTYDDPYMIDGKWSNGTCELDAEPLAIGMVDPVVVSAGVTWQIPTAVTLLNQNQVTVNGEIDNAGTFINNQINSVNTTPWGPGVLAVNNRFVNTGKLLTENGGYVYVSGSLSNSGSIQLQTGGNLNVVQGGLLDNASTITLASGTTLTDLGSIDNFGTIDNSGTVTANGSVLATLQNSNGGAIVNQNGGTTDGSGGTISTNLGATTVTLTSAYCAQIGGLWLVSRNACATLTGATLDAGTVLRIPSGVTLLNYGQFNAPGGIDNFGAIVNGYVLYFGNQLSNLGAAVVYNENGATISNYGLIKVQGGSQFTNNGTFLNAPPDPGNLYLVSAASESGSLQNEGSFTNNGVLNNFALIDNAALEGPTPSVQNSGTILNWCSGAFSGDGTYSGTAVASEGCGVPVPLEPTVVTLTQQDATIANKPLLAPAGMTLLAQVYPSSATGTITYLINGVTQLGATTTTGNAATLFVPTLPAGTFALSAAYGGSTQYMASSSEPYDQVSLPNSADQWQSLAVGDFDGDGHPDLAAVQMISSTIAILRNNGQGIFTQTHDYAIGQPQSQSFNASVFVTAADLNGDKNFDLVVVTGTGVSILLGNGDGSFQNPVAITAGDLPSTVVVADVNGDGKPDLILGNRGANYVTVLLGNGDGTFETPVNISVSDAPAAIAVGDFNQDGKLDILAASAVDKSVSVLLGNGDGTFQSPFVMQDGFQQPTALAVGDFNGDGFPDFAVADTGTNLVSVFLGNGDGTFHSAPGTAYSASASSSLISADFNRDGVPDLAFASQGAGSVTVLVGNGDGTFRAQPTSVLSASTNLDPAQVVAADVTGDGFLDLVTPNLNHPDYSILPGPLAGPSTPLVTLNEGPFTYDGNAHPATCLAVNNGNQAIAGSCTLTYNGSPTAPVSAGDYTVAATFTPADTTLYASAQANGSLIINPASPVLSVGGGTFTYDGNPHAAACSATGPGGAALAGNCVLTYDGASAVPVNAGTYAVTAQFAPTDTTDYAPVQATASLVIKPAVPVLTLTGGSFVYSATPHAATCAAADAAGAAVSGTCTITYSYVTPSGATVVSTAAPVDAGAYSLSAAFTSSDGNYATANATGGTLAITPAALRISANNATKVYGQPLPQFTASYTGFLGSDGASSLAGALTLTTLATAASPAGSYPITPGGLTSANYTISYLDGALSITPASLTVTANDVSSIYGQPLLPFTAAYAGFVNNDTPAALSGTLLVSTSAVQGSSVGSYTLTPGGLSSPNYTIAFVAGTLTVSPAPLVATALPASRSYWSPDPPLTGTLAGAFPGDGIAAAFVDTVPAGSAAGVYANAIVPQLADPNHRLGNYIVTLVDAALTITNPLPALQALSVDTAVVQSPDQPTNLPLTLTGSNFVPQSVVQWNGTALATTFVDQNHLSAVIPAASLAQAGVAYLTVSNSTAAGGGGVSNAEAFFITGSPTTVLDSATAMQTANGTLSIADNVDGIHNTLAANWTGTGDVTIAQYGADPGGAQPRFRTTRPPNYYDVYVAPGSSITSLTFTECSPGSNVAYWFNGASWLPASQQSYNTPTAGCLTVTVTSTTTPSIAQLNGTYFVTGVDLTPPSVDVIPHDRFFRRRWSREPVAIELRARDNRRGSGVAYITYSAAGAAAVAQTRVPGATAQFTISADGETTITYSATDYAGNTSKPKQFTVQVDTTPPVVTASASPDQRGRAAESVTISGAITDSASGVATAYYRFVDPGRKDSPGGPIHVRADGDYTLTLWLPRPSGAPTQADNQFTIEVIATDRAGNSASATVTITVPPLANH